ncbi:MAG: DUF6798 domain-containing protein [Bacteroidota bacterium]
MSSSPARKTTPSLPTSGWWTLLGLLACYAVWLAVQGYTYGRGDQVEVLPYTRWMQDPTLYPHDFYVQYIRAAVPNERYWFCRLLAQSGTALPWFCAGLHLSGSLLLLGGWYRIARHYLRSEALVWVLLLALGLPPFYGLNLGGNELYYNTFIPSLLAKSIGVWGLYAFLRERWWPSIVALIGSTLVHPVAGSQLFLLLGGVLLLEKGRGRLGLSWGQLGALAGSFLLTAGAWVVLLKVQFDRGSIDPALLFEIMEFRVAHHYFPAYFSLRAYVVLLPLFAGATWFYARRIPRLAWFFGLALLGAAVYTLGVYGLRSPSILAAQWFKCTIWLKALALLAVLMWGEEKWPQLNRAAWRIGGRGALLGLAGFGLAGMVFPFGPFVHRTYDFPWRNGPAFATTELDIAQRAQALTPADATFIIPIDLTSFKYHSQRSCYIDYKTVVHRKDALPIWYQRIQAVYGIDLQDRRAGRDWQKARQQYRQRSAPEWQAFHQRGVDYLLTTTTHRLDLPLITQNRDYAIYALGNP